ncbi:MAG: NAD(P)H-dependent glycerol-3-phosphate dehydrogenase [Alphaproteobacteria bacterium]|nr:NAD(P)H-dependent glycerol-3-phosphate dehydrogenase [Alphaproteobacteria bacterium]
MRVGVLGAGAWGRALAKTAERAGHEVRLWGRADGPERFDDAASAEVVVLAVPAQVMAETAARLDPEKVRGALTVAAKGLERGTGRLMSEVLGPGFAAGVLSGPNFAAEVAAGLPTAAVLAGAPQTAFATRSFRVYESRDAVGVQLCGALKNVIAIAAGITEGRRLGENARAALVTRGLAEIRRLVIAEGGEAETVAGLAGLGDLMLTATSPTSRNYAYGVALGRDEPPPAVLAEGAATAEPALLRAARAGVELPIAAAVADIVAGRADIDSAMKRLLARPAGRE